jgi:hypothetical protein
LETDRIEAGDDVDGHESRCEDNKPEFVPGLSAFFELESMLDDRGIDTPKIEIRYERARRNKPVAEPALQPVEGPRGPEDDRREQAETGNRYEPQAQLRAI